MRSVLRRSFVAEQAPECGTLTIKLVCICLVSTTRVLRFAVGVGVEVRGGCWADLGTLLGPEGSVAASVCSGVGDDHSSGPVSALLGVGAALPPVC